MNAGRSSGAGGPAFAILVVVLLAGLLGSLIAFVAISGGAFTGGAALGGEPGLAGGQGRPEQLEQLEHEIERGRRLEAKLPELEREIRNLEAQISEVDSALMVSDEADAEAKLRQTFEAVGFEVIAIRPSPAMHPDQVRLKVELSAPFRDWMALMQELMDKPLLVHVEDLRMTRAAEGERALLRFTAVLGRIPVPR